MICAIDLGLDEGFLWVTRDEADKGGVESLLLISVELENGCGLFFPFFEGDRACEVGEL